VRAAAIIAALGAAIVLGACGSPAALVLGLLPPGTFTSLLGNMESVSEPNRRKLAELEKNGDWRGIADFAGQNLQRDPQNAEWWMVRGFAFTQIGELQPAVESFQEAVRFEPSEMTAWHLLAETQRAMKQPDRAVRTLEAALRVNQDNATTWYLLGESYHDLGNYERAAQSYTAALTRDSRNSSAWYGLAVANYRLGRKSETDAALAGLRRVNPQLADKVTAQMAAQPAPR
jgi:cytochrome c-type biogenesis protein CcmH/NrfG